MYMSILRCKACVLGKASKEGEEREEFSRWYFTKFRKKNPALALFAEDGYWTKGVPLRILTNLKGKKMIFIPNNLIENEVCRFYYGNI